jgi:nitrite reductase (NADH) small subunit
LQPRELARVQDIPEGGVKIVKVGTTEIGIFNVGGEIHAFNNVCIHEGGPVCLGTIGGTNLPSDAHEYIFGLEGRVLRCPWHHWEFDLRTGRCLWGGKVGLAPYKVEVVDDKITVYC